MKFGKSNGVFWLSNNNTVMTKLANGEYIMTQRRNVGSDFHEIILTPTKVDISIFENELQKYLEQKKTNTK